MYDRPRGARHAAAAVVADTNGRNARVVAHGYGRLADHIVAEATRRGIHVHESPDLIELLMGLDLDERLPPQIYDVIALLLAWLARIDVEKQQIEQAAGKHKGKRHVGNELHLIHPAGR